MVRIKILINNLNQNQLIHFNYLVIYPFGLALLITEKVATTRPEAVRLTRVKAL
jgi:hypothetical protein